MRSSAVSGFGGWSRTGPGSAILFANAYLTEAHLPPIAIRIMLGMLKVAGDLCDGALVDN